MIEKKLFNNLNIINVTKTKSKVITNLSSKVSEVAQRPKRTRLKPNLFILVYKKLSIGDLSEKNNEWSFEYTTEFKNQEEIAPLIGFPDKMRKYTSSQLWPFFDSRIPSPKSLPFRISSNANKNEIDPENKVLLLRRFGRSTITNPFVLKHI